MATIGTFGPVVFEASAERLRTFGQLARTHKARFAVHDAAGELPKVQFMGRDLQEGELPVRFDARWVNPMQEVARLLELIASGRPYDLIVGGEVLGLYVLEQLDERRKSFDGSGRCLVAEVTLKLKEYN